MRRVLIAAPVMPEFDRESGSQRIFDHIMLLREAEWGVSFVAGGGCAEQRYAHLLQQRGVAVYRGFDERIERLLSRGKLDLAIFAFWHLGEAQIGTVRRLSPQTHIIIDTIDLHFLRNARRVFEAARAAERCLPERPPAGLDASDGSEMIRELNVYAAVDGVFAVSQKEAGLLGDLLNHTGLAHVVPDCEDLPRSKTPLGLRRGITFIGNFRHAPNVDAAEFLCREVVPLIDAGLLARHPLYLVGNALDDRIRDFAADHPSVRLVGWVPSVLPYLERARLSVVPLRYGAGTKRKLLQALMVGTPTVTTTVGVEGLGLRHGDHVLIADDPRAFAAAIEDLLRDDLLWKRLARRGRRHALALHSRGVARQRLLDALSSVLAKPVRRTTLHAPQLSTIVGLHEYRLMVDRVRQVVTELVPEGQTVAITSRGDEELLKLPDRLAWHFPQDERGAYAGHYPPDGAAAIDQVEALRQKGARFLVFPETARWWLTHYDDLRSHLETRYREVLRRDGTCVVFDLHAARKTSSGRATASTGSTSASGDNTANA